MYLWTQKVTFRYYSLSMYGELARVARGYLGGGVV